MLLYTFLLIQDYLIYALQLVIFAIASLLHGLTGLGFPMIGTIALAMIYPLPKAIAIMAFPSLIMNFLVLTTNREKKGVKEELLFYIKKYWLLALTTLIGSVVGVKLLLFIPAGVVYLFMAFITLYYVVTGYLSNRGIIKSFKIPTGTLSLIIFGCLAGIIGGATNAMSPILLMFLLAKTDNKNEIVKASNICYFLGKLVQVILLKDQILSFNTNEVISLLAVIITSIIFLYVGVKFRNRVSNILFKNIIYFILFLLSIKVGYTGLQFLLS